jgi:spermidine synthase
VTRSWTVLDTIPTADGALELRTSGPERFVITIAGRVLMTSVARRSEEALATLGCGPIAGRAAPQVLIGGLGMAYTLRAALDALPADAKLTVVELTPAVVRWCQGPLAALAAQAVHDPRVELRLDDVARHLRHCPPGSYDAILLDLYEGPHAATQRPDDPFWGSAALSRCHKALRPGGTLAIWSEAPDPAFPNRFAAAGFTVTTHRSGKGGSTHIVYLGERRSGR